MVNGADDRSDDQMTEGNAVKVASVSQLAGLGGTSVRLLLVLVVRLRLVVQRSITVCS